MRTFIFTFVNMPKALEINNHPLGGANSNQVNLLVIVNPHLSWSSACHHHHHNCNPLSAQVHIYVILKIFDSRLWAY